MLLLSRKAWIILAKSQLNRRKELFGEEANVCDGCLEILMCSGPISLVICQEVDELVQAGLMTGPNKIPWRRLRRKYLPIEEECLKKYGFKEENGRLVSLT